MVSNEPSGLARVDAREELLLRSEHACAADCEAHGVGPDGALHVGLRDGQRGRGVGGGGGAGARLDSDVQLVRALQPAPLEGSLTSARVGRRDRAGSRSRSRVGRVTSVSSARSDPLAVEREAERALGAHVEVRAARVDGGRVGHRKARQPPLPLHCPGPIRRRFNVTLGINGSKLLATLLQYMYLFL